MKKIILSLMAISSLGFSGGSIVPAVPIVADEIDETGLYIGAAISAMSSRDSSMSMDILNIEYGQDRLGNVNLLAGYMINNYLAIEGRYGFGITDEDLVEMNSRWSILLKPIYKFEDDKDRADGKNYFAVYALLGYGGMELQGVNGYLADVDATGFQWGFGASYTFRESSYRENYSYKDSWTVYADYTNVGNDMDGLYYNGALQIDADAFAVGIIYKF
jgi:hypothetical protein